MADTIFEGYRTQKEVKDAAAIYQTEGYTTVQCGPTASVKFTAGLDVTRWPEVDGQTWFMVIATKDPITKPATKPVVKT